MRSKLVQACKSRLQVTVTYKKVTTGEIVTHTGGIVEIRGDDFFFWDTIRNDHIRRMKFRGVLRVQILNAPFYSQFPIIIDGVEV